MCEFCLKHGEGKKWYLQAKNYSDDLLSDARRRRFIASFFSGADSLTRDVHRLDLPDKLPRPVHDSTAANPGWPVKRCLQALAPGKTWR
jgi:hypothetical protein